MSKKRSAANSSSKPLSAHTFFIDRSLGQKIVAQALRDAGATVVVHDDRFPPDAPDEDWLHEVGQRGWIVLTKDKRIRYRENERRALQRAGVAAFVFVGKDLTGEEIAKALVVALPRMIRTANQTRRPFIATVTPRGTVRLLLIT